MKLSNERSLQTREIPGSRASLAVTTLAAHVAYPYSTLERRGAHLWLDGGWGVDALLKEQTRSHDDLDAIVDFADLAILARSLDEAGFVLEQTWKENQWVFHPEPMPLIWREQPAPEIATAFVLQDDQGRQLDVHAIRFDESGRGIAAWSTDFVFEAEAFLGRGLIGDTPVRCLSAETQMRTHTGYVLQPRDRIVRWPRDDLTL